MATSHQPRLSTPRGRSDASSSAELRLLFAGCSPRVRTSEIEQILNLPIDWEYLEVLAQHHGVLPLLAHRLASKGFVLPGALLAEFGKIYEENVQHNLWFTKGLFLVLDSLEKAGIPAVPYKGPALSLKAYGDLGLRQFWDLDVLIARKSWPRAKTALTDAGFAPKLELTPRQEKAFVKASSEFTFHHGGVRNILEIQWALVPRFYAVDVPIEELIERAQSIELCERTVPMLAPEDLLLSLMVHGAKHLWVKLCWIADVAFLLNANSVDWDLVRKRAQSWKIQRIVLIGLFLARHFLDVAFPPQVSRWTKTDPVAARIADALAGDLIADRKVNVESLRYFSRFARQREHLRNRMQIYRRLATTPSIGEWEAVSLPGPLFPLYRFVRMYRLARRAIRS